MDLNLIALSVPLFLLAIAVELWVAWRRGQSRALYEFSDSFANIGCGITQQLVLRLFSVFLLLGYTFVYEHTRLFDLGTGPWVWVGAYLAVDFLYYLWHRASHRVQFMWAAHAVHHQSERYNLSVALRQGVFTPLTAFPFYLPLAVLGVPPLIYAVADALNTLYQFWIHTQLVDRVGPLEKVLNTPSHHRVHHAIEQPYIDKNYAATFIVWDRWLGTFAEEKEKPSYGITTQLRRWSPLAAQTQPWRDLWRVAREAPNPLAALSVFWKPPEWIAPWPVPEKSEAVELGSANPATLWYVAAQLGLAVFAAFALMSWGHGWSPALSVGLTGLVLLSLGTGAALLEAKPWAVGVEWGRLMLIAALGVAIFLTTSWQAWVPAAAVAAVLLSAPWLHLVARPQLTPA